MKNKGNDETKTTTKIFKTLNKLKSDSLIDDYAVCGSFALTLLFRDFPKSYNDIDIIIKNKIGDSVSSIYEYLEKEKISGQIYKPDETYYIFENVKFHFLWPYKNCFEEALSSYTPIELNSILVNVISREYAISMLKNSKEEKHKKFLSLISEN